MSGWIHDTALATWVTALIILLYTIETWRMRRQLMVQNTRAVLPFITVAFPNIQYFLVRNISSSPALNMSVDPLVISDELGLLLNFGILYTLTKEQGDVDLPRKPTVNGVPNPTVPWIVNFFPQVTLRKWRLTLRFQTIEGRHYKQVVIIRPARGSERPVEISPVRPDRTARLKRFWEVLESDPLEGS